MSKRLHRKIYDEFADELMAAFGAKFGIPIETEFNFMSMQRVSRRADGRKFTKEQHSFIAGYEDGYFAAANLVPR
jgi:hypothetical protein